MNSVSATLADSISAMAERYPSLMFRIEGREGKEVGIWEGSLQPIRTRADLNSIVCDMDEERPVEIDRDAATIGHRRDCTRQHNRHRIMSTIRRPDRPFMVRIEFDGGPTHPLGFLIDPEVTAETRYHIFGLNRICAYAPWTDAWRADDHNAADFTDHVLVWLFKWHTWVETRHWLGSEEDHRPMYLFSTIRPDMQCWCGSSQPYGECCRQGDQNSVEIEIQTMLKRRSLLLQKPKIDMSSLQTLPHFL